MNVLPESIMAYEKAIEHWKAKAERLDAKLAAIREIAAEAVNDHETPEFRLAMIVRLCDLTEVGRESDGAE